MRAGTRKRWNGWTGRCTTGRNITPRSAARWLCGYLGRAEEARQWIRRLLEANPAMTIAGFKALTSKYNVPGTMAVYVEGMRKAGLPEE